MMPILSSLSSFLSPSLTFSLPFSAGSGRNVSKVLRASFREFLGIQVAADVSRASAFTSKETVKLEG
jgi:hypothetical protein